MAKPMTVLDAAPTEATTEAPELWDYVPRTELGRELLRLRRRIIASGQPMLETLDDLQREVAERRGDIAPEHE